MTAHADDVAEVDVHLAGEQLDPPAPVDEVEEGDLPHLAPREHASGEPEALRLVGRAGLDLLRDVPDHRDLFPVGKALRQHGSEAYAAWMSRILYFKDPRGAATSTVSPFFLPMIALPTGDSFESFDSVGFASAEPTIVYSKVAFASTSRSLTLAPIDTTLRSTSRFWITRAFESRSSSC